MVDRQRKGTAMTHNDAPQEFQEDLIALDDYRSPHLKQIDPRIIAAMQQQAHAQFMGTLAISVAVFVLLLAMLP